MARQDEKDELHRVIWKMACDLVHGGNVSAWDFKSYVLGILFYRFISENITAYINKLQSESGISDYDYSKETDDNAESARNLTISSKGFFILPSELFCNVQKRAKNDSNLNETLNKVFKNIEASAKGTESEEQLEGLFDDVDVNSKYIGSTVEQRNKTLTTILESIAKLNLGHFTDNTIDLFGDAYEYLMKMYASTAGKKGGEFFTPQEVSELLAKIVLVGKKEVNKVYDPACGSGSLLLRFAKELKSADNVKQGFYGQEINITTYNLCRINMFLHNINYTKFDIALGDTLIEPKHWDDEPFDAIVSNPPYSVPWAGDSDITLINDPRFSPAGVLAPRTKADLAFTMHMLSWLSTEGTAAIVEFPGVLYRGGAEQKIRKYLVDNNFVDCIIQLPQNLFFGVGIATCIIVLKKSKKDNSVLFIDASEKFIKDGNKNQLSPDDIKDIMQAYTDRTDKEYFCKLVSSSDIGDNDYNLSASTYVEQKDNREIIDITQLNQDIAQIVAREDILRKSVDEIVADLEGVA